VLKKSLHDHYFVFLTKHLILAFFWGRGRERGGDEFLVCGDDVLLYRNKVFFEKRKKNTKN